MRVLWHGRSNANTSYIAATHGHGSSREFGESENQNIIGHQCENSNISLPLSNLDLHTYATRSLQDGSANDPTGVESPSQDHFEMPGCLSNYEPVSMPSSVYWGRKSDGAEIWLNTIAIAKAYNKVTTRRKNTFLVPYGKIGRDFIDQVAKHNNDWNNKSDMNHRAVTAVIVLLAFALQKPRQGSKAKDHQECLSMRLALWKEGEIDTLLREGRMIQKRLTSLEEMIHRIKLGCSQNWCWKVR